MPQITVMINGKTFRMACDEGEEERLQQLASRFDGWITELKGAFGEIGDQRLTVMAGIMATDQLVELERRVGELQQDLEKTRDAQSSAVASHLRQECEIAERIDQAAAQIERLSEGLSKSLKPQ